MKKILMLLLLFSVVGCAAKSGVSGPVNSKLTPGQRDDMAMMTHVVQRNGLDFYADLRDLDGNGELDLIYTGSALDNPEEALDQLAETNGMFMAGCGYPIDKLVAVIGPDTYVASFRRITDCAWGELKGEDCETWSVWKKN